MDQPPPNLDPESYTYHRLNHATPEHLYLTARRCFIGPIPEGWLRSHHKSWYKHHLHINYSSRAATFSANQNVSRQKRLTGLEGPSAAALYTRSFPQPIDASEEDGGEGEDTTAAPPALAIPLASKPDEDLSQTDRSRSAEDEIIEEAQPLDDGDDSSADKDGVGARAESVANESPGRLKLPLEQKTSNNTPVTMQKPKVSEEQNATAGPSNTDRNESPEPNRVSLVSTQNGALSSNASAMPGADTSTSSLIQRDAKLQEERPESRSKSILGKVTGSKSRPLDGGGDTHEADSANVVSSARRKSRIHFDLPEESTRAALVMKARMTQMELKRPLKRALRRRSELDGQIIKMEKMLVRIDTTLEKNLPDDYDENSSQGVISQTLEKWREFMVVCRQSSKAEEAEFVLQIYKTRVIPAVENAQTRKRATREIPLGQKYAKVNLYSSLDKSVVVWVPEKRGTKIIILRPRTGANGVEWYAFLRNVLGWQRASELQVNVPDLSVSLRIEDPFKDLNRDYDEDEDEETAAQKAMAKEQGVARGIVDRCLDMLKTAPEWENILSAWSQGQKIGLAWKRYDRLEWIHGANERKMYGTIAMIKSHELELRPKQHYPTRAQTRKGKQLTEPAPVEGFLIRLTSQKGVHQRMGKLFFKQLYFHSHDHYLVFSRPAKADPPPPPRMPATESSRIPSSRQIADSIPLVYAVNPYPVQDGQVTWLASGQCRTPESTRHHDEDALDEFRRKVNNLAECDGFIDLCNVVKVRKVHRGATPTDEQVDSGSDVDFDMDVDDTWEDDGATTEFNDDRSFELVLKNSLVIRLQAFDKETKKEWKKRLRALVKYWKYRHTSDMDLLKAVRKQNLEELQIDEETEAVVGQFAKKWEVTKSFASAELYNMCGISCCRTVHISGLLYRKPRLHSLFTSAHCILIPGKLLLFSTTLRAKTGKSVPHIHHEKMDVIDLTECYLYSGLLTENDLLYQNRTFDSNNPGHNALPRMWLDDQWTSRDEDVMSCFVLWRSLNKGWFRAPGAKESGESSDGGTRAKLKRVSQLGATGRSIVFRARSRAERDHWVLAIGTEIERLQGGEDVRLTSANQKKEKEN